MELTIDGSGERSCLDDEQEGLSVGQVHEFIEGLVDRVIARKLFL